MYKSESITELAKALSTFQSQLKPVKKDAVNPFFKSHYATLEAIWETIREPLSKNGLSVTQTFDGYGPVETTLMHSSGEWVGSILLIKPVKEDPQGVGSAISYARRYSLSAILGVVSDEDDDANIATTPETKTSKAKPVKSEPEKAEPEKDPNMMTDAQRRKIFATAKEKGYDKDLSTAIMIREYSVSHTSELTKAQASDFIEKLTAGVGLEEKQAELEVDDISYSGRE